MGIPEAKQRTGDERVDEELVDAHVGLLGSHARDQLNGLLRGEAIHGGSSVVLVA